MGGAQLSGLTASRQKSGNLWFSFFNHILSEKAVPANDNHRSDSPEHGPRFRSSGRASVEGIDRQPRALMLPAYLAWRRSDVPAMALDSSIRRSNRHVRQATLASPQALDGRPLETDDAN